jgi:hypothetical protein
MLADSREISGKSLMGFGSSGHYSIEHLYYLQHKIIDRAFVLGGRI